MLRRDDELRLSEAMQQRYAHAGDSAEGKERVTESIQRQVVREAGFSGAQMRIGLDLLRGATALFPGDEDIRNAAFYLRHNTHVPCPIPVGSPAHLSVSVWEVRPAGSAPLSLRDALGDADLTVLVAGSGT